MTTADNGDQVLGRDRERTVRYLLVAAGILLIGLGLLDWRWTVTPRGIGLSAPGVDLVWIVAVVAVGLAVTPGYLDDGLLAGWMLGTAPFVARGLWPAVVPARAFHQPILVGLATAVVLGVVAGSIGFGIGVGLRRVREAFLEADRTVGA